MHQNYALHVPRELAEARHAGQDLVLAARQARINDGRAVGVRDDKWICDDARDDENIVGHHHASQILCRVRRSSWMGRERLRTGRTHGLLDSSITALGLRRPSLEVPGSVLDEQNGRNDVERKNDKIGQSNLVKDGQQRDHKEGC